MTKLADLESKSVFIIREVIARYKNPAMMCFVWERLYGLALTHQKACYGKVPFPVVHVDTTYQFPELYEFRDWIVKEWDLNLIVAKNEAALARGLLSCNKV